MRLFFLLFLSGPFFLFPISTVEVGEETPLTHRVPETFQELDDVTGSANTPPLANSTDENISTPSEMGAVTELDGRLKVLNDLLEKNQYEKFRCLAWEAFQTWGEDDLKELANLAFDHSVFDISLELGRRFEDLKLWGFSAFELGAYSEAYWVLIDYLEKEKEPTYVTPYLIGEIFWFWERKCEAYTYFRIAKERIEKELAATDDAERIIKARSTLAAIHYKEKNETGALKNLKNLLSTYPDRYSIAAFYAYYLTESGYFKSAKCLFDRYLTTPWAQWEEFKTDKGASLIDLYLEKVRYLQTVGKTESAFALLYPLIELQETIPNPDSIWASLAQVEGVVDYFRQESASYCMALEENPVSEIYPHDWWEDYQDHRSSFNAEGELLHTIPGQNEHIYRGELFKRFGLPSFIDATIEVDHYCVDDVQDAVTGNISNQKGDRWRLFLNYGYDSFSANQLIVGLYFAQQIVGGKAIFTALDERGATFIEGNYHYPAWEIIETTTQHGLYDQVKLGRSQYFTRHFFFNGWTAYRLWDVAGIHQVATSWATYWDITWSFDNLFIQRYLGDTGSLNVIYNLDAEYIFDRKYGITQDFYLFERLPLITQETHSIYVYLNKEFNPHFRAEGFVGYSANRHGTSAPDYGMKLIWKKKNCWRVIANYSHQAGTVVENSTVEQFLLGAYVAF